MIEIEYMKHDEPAKTSVGEVAGYGYERRQGPCGRLTSDPWRSPPAAARGRRHAVCERGERLSKGGLCLSLSCLMCHHRRSTHPQWLHCPLSTLFREAVDLKGAERGSTY